LSEISKWIISICGIVLVGVLIEVVLPDGRTSKLLKTIVGIFSVLIIILPLKNFDFGTLDFSGLTDLVIDEEFVKERESEKIAYVENELENNLELNGYLNVSVKIDGEYNSDELQISSLYVDIENMVLNDEALNINKYTNIVAIIKASVEVSEENVIFYE
jgi:hypothetical protein